MTFCCPDQSYENQTTENKVRIEEKDPSLVQGATYKELRCRRARTFGTSSTEEKMTKKHSNIEQFYDSRQPRTKKPNLPKLINPCKTWLISRFPLKLEVPIVHSISTLNTYDV